MSNPSSITPSSGKGKVAERLAFDPFTSQQDIINQYIRDIINPDIDTGQMFYVGSVVSVISNDDKDIDTRDVFFSESDNHERATKSNVDKKYNTDRKVLLVHIPSFLTNAVVPTTRMNYNTFTKIRVEFTGKIKVGDFVKIQFRDKNSFYGPTVIEVIEMNLKDVEQQQKQIVDKFNDFLNCKVLNINFPKDIGSIDTSIVSTPAGGYSRAYAELNSIFSNSYIEGFKKTIDKKTFGNINIFLEKVLVSKSTFESFPAPNNISYKIGALDKEDYLIVGEDEDVRISCTEPNKNEDLKNRFFAYIKTDINSRCGFTFSYGNDKEKPNKFLLDINSNFFLNKEEKTEQDYIEVSKKFGNNSEAVKNLTYDNKNNKSASSQIGEVKKLQDKCDAEITKEKTTYQLVYDKSGKQKATIKGDEKILKDFFENDNYDTKVFISKLYFNKLMGTNPSGAFYTTSQMTNDSYTKGAKNILNTKDLQNNFEKISNILQKLKTQIEILEVEQQFPNDVLILPTQVFKKKEFTTNSKLDKNSRHYYGKAVDFRVYIKIRKNEKAEKIVQIPPEIVFLYVNVETVKQNNILGNGIFLDGNKRYNHVELLGSSKEEINLLGLTQEQINEKLLYTGDSDFLEKQLEASPPGQTRIVRLKEIVRSSPNYINSTTKRLDPIFEILTA